MKSLSNLKAINGLPTLIRGFFLSKLDIRTKNFCESEYCIYHEHIVCFQESHLRQGSHWPSPNHLSPYEDIWIATGAHFIGVEPVCLLRWPHLSWHLSWSNVLKKGTCCTAASWQISTWHRIWSGKMTDFWKRNFAEKIHPPLIEKAATQHTAVSSRLVLAKTTVLSEKNIAKKLTLGGMGEHRAWYLHFFQVSFKFWKSLLKVYSTVTRNVFSVVLEWFWGRGCTKKKQNTFTIDHPHNLCIFVWSA